MQDLRLAFRSLRATPVVTAVAVLSLALGIGANTAIFSLVDSLLLRALPVADSDRLALVSQSGQTAVMSWTYAIWDAIRERARPFDGAAAWSSVRFNLSDSGETQPVDGMYVNGDYFATLGVPALLGRTLTSADDVRNGGPEGPAAVISYAFWQRRYGGAAGVIGTRLVVDRVPFAIVGVTPPSFFGAEVGRTFDVAVPIGCEPLIHGRDTALDRRSNWWLTVMLRLKRGQSLEAATAALRGIQPQVRDAAMPSEVGARLRAGFIRDPFVLVPAATGLSTLRFRYQRPLLTILAVVALVLLIACANIANLQLARAAARRHEMSVRVALGASRWRLARQLLIESLVLSTAGAGTGLLFAAWGSRALVAQLSTRTSHVALNLPLDWRVLAFTAAVTIVTALLFGAAPAVHAIGAAPFDALKAHARGSGDHRSISVSNGLIVAQVALSLVLVVAAALFVRTFVKLAAVPLGFDRDPVLVVDVTTLKTQSDVASRLGLYRQLTDAVSAVPGVARAAASVVTPVSGSTWSMTIEVPGAPARPESERNALINIVTPGWFSTYGTPILAGRDVDAHDTASSLHVALVNEAFVRRFLPGRNPIGTVIAYPTFTTQAPFAPRQIIGVVADAVYRNLREPIRPTTYYPLAQYDNFGNPLSSISISVRTAGASPLSLARAIAAALAETDRDLAFSFRPLKDQIDSSLTQERVVAMLAGFFGGLALLLAGLGLYGVTSYAVNRRRSEIGIRVALGAAPSGVVRLVLARVSILVGLGVIVGAAISLSAATFVASLLYGLEPRDPITLAASVVVLSAVGALAGWLPARRASRIDPAEVLRES